VVTLRIRMTLRKGVSQVTTAVVLMVLGIALAVLVYQVVLGTSRGSYSRIEAGTPKSNIKIMDLDPGNPSNGVPAKIYVRNLGPLDIEFSGPQEWQVFIDNQPMSILTMDPAQGTLGVNEVLNITLTEAVNASFSHTIKVYGPYATVAFAGWSPGGG